MKIKKGTLLIFFMLVLVFSSASVSGVGGELFYINPPDNETDLCPCCIELCIGVNNTNGNLMNITFWSNLSMEYWDYFYLGVDNVTFAYVSNGTYCFNALAFVLYNHTYYWFVNVTDTVTGEYNASDIYCFSTTENINSCNLIGESMEISLTEFSVIISFLLFIFLFWIGYTSEKRSGGVFMVISGFMLFYLEVILIPYVSIIFVIPFISPLAIFLILIGFKKFLYTSPEEDKKKTD